MLASNSEATIECFNCKALAFVLVYFGLVHAYNPCTWEVEAEEFEASLGCYYLACVGAG